MERKGLATIQEFASRGFVRRRIWQTDHLHCNIYCFEPGQQNSLHRHPVADEVAFCWEGEGIIVVGNDHAPFRAGETVLLPVDTHDGYLNTGQDGQMIVTVVQRPLPVEHVAVEPGELTAVLN